MLLALSDFWKVAGVILVFIGFVAALMVIYGPTTTPEEDDDWLA